MAKTVNRLWITDPVATAVAKASQEKRHDIKKASVKLTFIFIWFDVYNDVRFIGYLLILLTFKLKLCEIAHPTNA